MVTIAESNRMIEELHTVADALKPLLPAADIECFTDLIDHSEVGVGVEILRYCPEFFAHFVAAK